MKEKFKSICVDTLTGIQNEIHMCNVKKPNYDVWTDYGQELWRFIVALQDCGFELIMIIGDPGTGKSSGMRTLEPGTNIWFNADNKNPVWEGGIEEYGKKNKPIMPKHLIPKTYQEILQHVNEVGSRDLFEEDRYAFLTGHIEDYKSASQNKQRLKVLGKQATKLQIEGKFENVFYSNVVVDEDSTRRYVLETQNNGFNTARSVMNKFPLTMENDYKLIIDTLS